MAGCADNRDDMDTRTVSHEQKAKFNGEAAFIVRRPQAPAYTHLIWMIQGDFKIRCNLTASPSLCVAGGSAESHRASMGGPKA